MKFYLNYMSSIACGQTNPNVAYRLRYKMLPKQIPPCRRDAFGWAGVHMAKKTCAEAMKTRVRA